MTSIVVDANLAVYIALGAPKKLEGSVALFWEKAGSAESDIELFAPRLWWSETTSIVRAYEFQKAITQPEAASALQILDSLRLSFVNESAELSARALDWARRLGQAKAYDAMYVASAENLGGELWTADERLANSCRSLGLSWVHEVSEI